MDKIINVLIIDNFPLAISAYSKVLNFLSEGKCPFNFKVQSISNIKNAIEFVDYQKLSDKPYLLFLEICLPKNNNAQINSGEDLGVYIKSKIENVKIIVITSLNDNVRLLNIIKRINPDGLLIKSDVDEICLELSIKKILNGHKFYSTSIGNLLCKRFIQNIILDDLDINLLTELSNGSKMKELQSLLPLSKSGIDKRKSMLRNKLGVTGNSDRDLVLAAKGKGFI